MRVIVAVIVASGIGAGALVACGAAGPGHPVEHRSSSGRVRVAVGAGISIRRAAAWHVVTAPLTRVLWPVQRLVMTSFRLRQARPDPNCTPATAIRELPPTGAFLFMFEYTRIRGQPAAHFPTRPAHFRLEPKSYRPYECMGPSYAIEFRDAGRAFQVQLFIGTRASQRTRATLVSILDSLIVKPRPVHRIAPPIGVALHGLPIEAESALGSVWVLTCERNCSGRGLHSSGQLFRISRSTGRIVQRIGVVDPTAFAIGGGAIWLTHFNLGSVSRVDPWTGHTTQTVSLALPTPIVAGDRQFLPVNISAGQGSVWVSTARGWLAQIDSSSSRLVRIVRAPGDVTGQVIIGSDATWVAESSLGVGVVRPGSHRLKLLWIKSGSVGAVAVDQIARGGGRVWAYGEIAAGATRNGGGMSTNMARVVVVDQRTGRVIRQLPLPNGPYEIAYGSGDLFAANYRTGRLFRIDANYRVHALQSVRGAMLIAVTPGAIWATTKSGLVRRIAIPTR